MINSWKIWVRQLNMSLKFRIRELFRRQLRKLLELALTDMDLMGRIQDAASSSAFEAKHLSGAAAFKHRIELYRWVLAQVDVPGESGGLFLEFGVYKGESINHLSKLRPNAIWYGFDSFVGLPEAWTLGAKAGAFSVDGKLPAVRDNVRLIKGFFEDTLPRFVAEHRGEKIALVHVDCDLYSATKTILTNMKDMIVPGTIILFDELINYHGWQGGEYKAFTEFVSDHKIHFEYLGYTRTASQVAVRILE